MGWPLPIQILCWSNISKSMPNNKVNNVNKFHHTEAWGGHFSSKKVATKILQFGFYWLTSFKDKQVLQNIQKLLKIGIYFKIKHDAFESHSYDWNFWLLRYTFYETIFTIIWLVYMSVAIDYVSIWIDAIPSQNIDHKIVTKFLKENLLSQFGISHTIISDGETHFYNKPFESLIKKKNEITHKITTLKQVDR